MDRVPARGSKAYSVVPTRRFNLLRRSSLSQLSGGNIYNPPTRPTPLHPPLPPSLDGYDIGSFKKNKTKKTSRSDKVGCSGNFLPAAWRAAGCYQLEMRRALKFHTALISKVSRTLLFLIWVFGDNEGSSSIIDVDKQTSRPGAPTCPVQGARPASHKNECISIFFSDLPIVITTLTSVLEHE